LRWFAIVFGLVVGGRLLACGGDVDGSPAYPTEAVGLLGRTRPTVYPYLVDPVRYPDYTRRPSRAPTWATFENRPQFVALRTLPAATDTNQGLGTVCMPGITLVSDPSLAARMDELKRRGCYLFDVGGYVPGSIPNQVRVPPATLRLLEDKLGDRFLGFDVGEQDGRYLFNLPKLQAPFFNDRLRQFRAAQEYFGRMEEDLGPRLNALMVYWYWPYPIKGGQVVLAGAETQNKVTSASVHYAFLRGAGKQYGVLWFGNASVFNTWHHKAYHEETDTSGPTKGNSLSLLRRLLFSHYLYNSVILGFEGGLFERDWWSADGQGALSPLGLMQQDAVRFVEAHPQPGVMHTPIAVLVDFLAGWMPARTWTTAYRVWGYVPYDSGDHLTHNVLGMLYPGYEDCGWYHDERGTVCPTPYGDMADVLHSDTTAWVLRQYGMVVVAGNLFTADAELRAKLDAYVRAGGTLVVSAENARRLWPEWGIGPPRRYPPNSVVLWNDGARTPEPQSMDLCAMIPADQFDVIARCGPAPAVARRRHGGGEILLLLSPFGINAEPAVSGELAHHNWDRPLAQPHTLLAHVRRVLDAAFRSQRLFSVGEGLGYVTCRKGPGDYTVGVFNNGLASQPFRIVSHCGSIRNVTELTLGRDLRSAAGYWPHEFPNPDAGRSDPGHIAGGDLRLFSVQVDEAGVRVLPEGKAPARPVGCRLALRDIADLREEITRRPTFFEHFEGVKIDWTYLLERDGGQVRRDRSWLEHQQVRVVVDFTSGLNHFPGLTLLDLRPESYAETVAFSEDVFGKMHAIGSTEAVMATHMPPEFGATPEQVEASFLRGLRDWCRRAKARGITLYLQNRPSRWRGSVPEVLRLIDELGVDNLRFALNTSTADLRDSVRQAGDRLGLVLASAPGPSGTEMQRPLAQGVVDVSALQALKIPVVLDADYAGPDEVFRDAMAVWGPHSDSEPR
jgi:hypothetical protein